MARVLRQPHRSIASIGFPDARNRLPQPEPALSRAWRPRAEPAGEEETRPAAARRKAGKREFVLLLSCRDGKGVVHAVSGVLFHAGCSIIDSQQFGDIRSPESTGLFYMRVHFDAPASIGDIPTLEKLFAHVGEKFGMTVQLHELGRKLRALILVSRQGHCLNDLLFRQMTDQLPVDIACVVSNHATLGDMVRGHGSSFHHFALPAGASARAKRAQERRIQALIERERADLVVLARYMQILTPEFCKSLRGRAINIHHSFLPSFKGAHPYRQAYRRGVKLIGATAHYVTADLDEGPIIEQDVARVDHTLSADDLAAIGRDVERIVLARAVKWHAEHRVLLNGHKTVVFR